MQSSQRDRCNLAGQGIAGHLAELGQLYQAKRAGIAELLQESLCCGGVVQTLGALWTQPRSYRR